MKWSEIYIPTLREDPAEAEIDSHKLLVRAGYIRKLAAGIYNYLPLMQRVLLKITNIVREEMNNAGAQEILMPVLHPAELWQASGRWEIMGKEQMRMKDRNQRDLVLGGTHEEVITTFLKGEIRSYRQLPLNLYQIQVKFRDEIRPRFGLLRAREFYMKDAYSFDTDEESFKISYQKMLNAYKRVFDRCGLDTKMVESDTGAMGGKAAHEFIVLVDTASGESVVFSCDSCSYAATVEKAISLEEKISDDHEKEKPLNKVSTPNLKTVVEITNFLNVSPKKLVKTLLYKADNQIIAALIRGDQELNEVKLKNLIGAKNLEMADAATVEKITGAKVGFSGPIGLKNLKIIADLQIAKLKNAVTGANENDFHLTDVNFKRDFKADQIADIRNVVSGETCPHCKKGKLTSSYGIEVGNTFMLGTKYSESLGAKFLDRDGNEKPFVMGSYGIGITRTAQAAVEKFNDDKGIIWPNVITPFSIVITPTDWNNDKIKSKALEIYEHLIERNVATLLDDRDERPGVKFNDADLIGIPLRVTLGPKNLEKNQVEIQIRKTKETIHVPPAEAVSKCLQLLENL
ncbi:MAG: hypothetical protein RBG1_1C00001G1150 [candidate division Zixibacteria bacterium RBG-1]|nr:MAG: hypothetical protein RBG1_1C00001G1150 [candidate division Zixibacteria bacterium RBG-1]